MFANLGWKTLATAAVLVGLGGLQLAGVDMSAYTTLSPVDCFLGAASLIGLRHGISKLS